jgi:hypothetical protein
MADKRCKLSGCKKNGCGPDGLCNEHHWFNVYSDFIEERRQEGQTHEDILWFLGSIVHAAAEAEAECEEEEKETARLKRKEAKSAAAGGKR